MDAFLSSGLVAEFGAFRLAWPVVLLALLIPLLPALLGRGNHPPAPELAGAIALPFGAQLPRVGAPLGLRRVSLAGWLVFALLVLAASRPQWIDPVSQRPASGRDVLLLLDVSASMKTRDIEVAANANANVNAAPLSRLAVATRLGRAFLERRPGDRAGLILFGSRSYLYVPLTYDLAAVGSALDGAAIGLAGEQTALGDAVAQAVRTLTGVDGNRSAAGAVAVVISDGANTAGKLSLEQATWLATQRRVRVHALAVGRVPEQQPLQQLAKQTGGFYSQASDALAISRFFAQIDATESAQREGEREVSTAIARELYALPLLGALVVMAIQWLGESLGRRRLGVGTQ